MNEILSNFKKKLKVNIEPSDKVAYVCDEKLAEAIPDLCPFMQSSLLDEFFEINSLEIEKQLAKDGLRGNKTWIGLDPQTLQTPFSEISSFLSFLKLYSPKRVVDFGAGYGRVGILMKGIMEECTFLGYEYIRPRFREMEQVFRKLGIKNSKIFEDDILSEKFKFPKANVYFVYDFSDLSSIESMTRKFVDLFDKDQVFLVVRGKAMRSLIQAQYRELYALNGAIHTDNWSIYSSHVDLDGIEL